MPASLQLDAKTHKRPPWSPAGTQALTLLPTTPPLPSQEERMSTQALADELAQNEVLLYLLGCLVLEGLS